MIGLASDLISNDIRVKSHKTEAKDLAKFESEAKHFFWFIWEIKQMSKTWALSSQNGILNSWIFVSIMSSSYTSVHLSSTQWFYGVISVFVYFKKI